MGFDFDVLDKTGLLPLPSSDASEEACTRWFEAPWQQTGWLQMSYSNITLQEVVRILKLTGVWDEMSSPDEWPAIEADDQVWQAFMSQESPKPFRVPSFKFTMGSQGWIITPRECKSIAYALRGSDNERVRNFGDYCEFAAKRGGFTIG